MFSSKKVVMLTAATVVAIAAGTSAASAAKKWREIDGCFPAVEGSATATGIFGLDWISFIHPLGPFGITPWDPPTGLSFVFALLFGRRYLPLLFVAPFLADYLVRAPYASFPLALSTATIIGAGYSVAALALLHPARRFDVSLSAMRDLFLLLGVAIVSAAGVAAGCITVYAAAGFVDWSQFGMAMVRYWVGDVIGIAVPTPFLLITLTRGRPFRLGWESALQFLTIGIALMAVFLLGQSRQLQLFYILFLPIRR